MPWHTTQSHLTSGCLLFMASAKVLLLRFVRATDAIYDKMIFLFVA